MNLSLSRVSSIIELGAVGKGESLYIHQDYGKSPSLAETVLQVGTHPRLSGQAFESGTIATVDNAELPPASTHSFLRLDPNIPAVVITDYLTEFNS